MFRQGVEFASATGGPWDYTRYLSSFSYSGRILHHEHAPLTADVTLSAGWLAGSSAVIPRTERFYGGSAAAPLIAGDEASPPAQPLIRSFPVNWFAQSGYEGAFGSKEFQSLNLTLTQVWRHYPAVPEDVGSDRELRRNLGLLIGTARNADTLTYLVDDRAFVQLANGIPSLAKAFDDVEAALPPVVSLMQADSSASADLQDTSAQIQTAKLTISNRPYDTGKVRALVLGFGKNPNPTCADPDILAGIADPPRLIDCDFQDFADRLPAGTARTNLETALNALRTTATALRGQYLAVMKLIALSPDDQVAVLKNLADLKAVFQSMMDAATALGQLPEAQDPAASQALAALQVDLQHTVKPIGQTIADPTGSSSILDWLCRGFGDLVPPFGETIAAEAEAVARAFKSPAAQGVAAALVSASQGLKSSLSVSNSLARRIRRSSYERRAIYDTDFTGRVLDSVIRELNIAAVAPLLLFDAARLGPHRGTAGGVRYAAGPGVRLSLANWNVNFGYGFTLDRRRAPDGRNIEPFGAFTVSISVTDLFR